MSVEETINTIKVAMAEIEWEYPLDYQVAFEQAIKALETLDAVKTELGKSKNKTDLFVVCKIRGIMEKCNG